MTVRMHGGNRNSRGEITDTVDRSDQDMTEKNEDLDKIRADVLKVRETLDNLEFGGTAEGSDAVETSFEEAEDATVDVFDTEDEQMDGIQSKNEEYQGEIQEHADTDESDLGKISDASAQIETEVTITALIEVKNTALQDIDFLIAQLDRARDAREESENTQQDYRSQVHSGGGRRR